MVKRVSVSPAETIKLHSLDGMVYARLQLLGYRNSTPGSTMSNELILNHRPSERCLKAK